MTPYERVLEDLQALYNADAQTLDEMIKNWGEEILKPPTFDPRTIPKEQADPFFSRMKEMGFEFFWIPNQRSLRDVVLPGAKPGYRDGPRRLYWWAGLRNVERTTIYDRSYIGDFIHELGHWIYSSPSRRKLINFGLEEGFPAKEETIASLVSLIISAQFDLDHRFYIMSDFDQSQETLARMIRIMKSLKKQKKSKRWLDSGFVHVDGERL